MFSDNGSDSDSDSKDSVIRRRQNKTMHPLSNYSDSWDDDNNEI